MISQIPCSICREKYPGEHDRNNQSGQRELGKHLVSEPTFSHSGQIGNETGITYYVFNNFKEKEVDKNSFACLQDLLREFAANYRSDDGTEVLPSTLMGY